MAWLTPSRLGTTVEFASTHSVVAGEVVQFSEGRVRRRDQHDRPRALEVVGEDLRLFRRPLHQLLALAGERVGASSEAGAGADDQQSNSTSQYQQQQASHPLPTPN